MKKTIYITLFLFLSYPSFAQADTSKIEQYCQMIATPSLFSNKVTIDINFGEEKSFSRDTRFKAYDGKFKRFNTIIDALNFMGQEGWIFINGYPVCNNEGEIYHFGFKKLFPRLAIKAA